MTDFAVAEGVTAAAAAGHVGGALRLDVPAVMRDGDLLGRLVDTLAVAQLRPEVDLASHRPVRHHVREKDGRREIDLVIEVAGGGSVALEIKAIATPTAADARHLARLPDNLDDRVIAGAVLQTGPRVFRLVDRVLAVPICAL